VDHMEREKERTEAAIRAFCG